VPEVVLGEEEEEEEGEGVDEEGKALAVKILA